MFILQLQPLVRGFDVYFADKRTRYLEQIKAPCISCSCNRLFGFDVYFADKSTRYLEQIVPIFKKSITSRQSTFLIVISDGQQSCAVRVHGYSPLALGNKGLNPQGWWFIPQCGFFHTRLGFPHTQAQECWHILVQFFFWLPSGVFFFA